MKTGKTLDQLAEEILKLQNTKKDFIVPTTRLTMEADADLVFGGNNFKPTDLAHRQIAEHCGIPHKYYQKMLTEKPDLLANNVQTWFEKYPAQRMVRTQDGRCRAFLSDRYRPMEHIDLVRAVVPTLQELGVEVLSADVTDTRLYIKAVDQRIKADVPSGRKMGDGSHVFFDTVCPAITISNSEVGLGRLLVETSIFTKVCTNLATIGASLKKHHVGGKNEFVDTTYELLSDEARSATDKALWLQARDVVKGAFEETRFQALTDKMAGLSKQAIDGDPIKVVELTAARFDLNNIEQGSVLKHLISGGDMTRYGLMNAITRSAEDNASYDRATEIEHFGGQIIDLTQNDWAELAKAA